MGVYKVGLYGRQMLILFRYHTKYTLFAFPKLTDKI